MKELVLKIMSIGRFWIALTILGVLFFYYPTALNSGFDMNLSFIKWIGQFQGFGGHAEAFLRFLNAERLFLVGELSFTLWFIPWVTRNLPGR
jgi:hypothetical protein